MHEWDNVIPTEQNNMQSKISFFVYSNVFDIRNKYITILIRECKNNNIIVDISEACFATTFYLFGKSCM